MSKIYRAPTNTISDGYAARRSCVSCIGKAFDSLEEQENFSYA